MKYIKFIIPTIIVGSAILFGACSDEPEANSAQMTAEETMEIDEITENCGTIENGSLVYGKREFSIIESLISSKKTTAFEPDGSSLYTVVLDENGDINEWKDLSNTTIWGGAPNTPLRFVLGNNKVWLPMHLFSSSYGPSAFAIALGAVKIKLHKDYYVYAARPYNLDAEKSTITISGIPYELMQITKGNITLNHLNSFKSDDGSQLLQIVSYGINQAVSFDDGKNLGFDSVEDAYNWLIDLFRENFGEKVNLNTLYYPDIILDQPYFYISGLESERDMYVNASAK